MKQYVLKAVGLPFYLADDQKLSGCNLTSHIKDARVYAYEEDEPARKLKVWGIIAKIEFEAVVL